MERLYFYKVKDEYGEFSNFYYSSFIIDGKEWKTVEHYFQAKEFEGTEYEEKIRNIEKAIEAAKAGRDRSLPLRSDWNEIKNVVMYKGAYEKFNQNKELRAILLSTGKKEIIEETEEDNYWGCGKKGDGENMLGKILMRVREELKDTKI